MFSHKAALRNGHSGRLGFFCLPSGFPIAFLVQFTAFHILPPYFIGLRFASHDHAAVAASTWLVFHFVQPFASVTIHSAPPSNFKPVHQMFRFALVLPLGKTGFMQRKDNITAAVFRDVCITAQPDHSCDLLNASALFVHLKQFAVLAVCSAGEPIMFDANATKLVVVDSPISCFIIKKSHCCSPFKLWAV